MANRLRLSPQRLNRGPRRQTEWLASADVVAVTGLDAGLSLLDQFFTQAQIQAIGPFTIVRVVGSMFAKSDQTAGIESPFGAFAMMVVRE